MRSDIRTRFRSMGNGVWTVEIIPAEIQPPARTPSSASGNRIRIGTGPVTNWGDAANLVVAFNEQVSARAPPSRCVGGRRDHSARGDVGGTRRPEHPRRMDRGHDGARGAQLPHRARPDGGTVPHRGRRTTQGQEHVRARPPVVGVLAGPRQGQGDDRRRVPQEGQEVYERNVQLLELGYQWADDHLDFKIDVPPPRPTRQWS